MPKGSHTAPSYLKIVFEFDLHPHISLSQRFLQKKGSLKKEEIYVKYLDGSPKKEFQIYVLLKCLIG
jgi:hypothetical protein